MTRDEGPSLTACSPELVGQPSGLSSGPAARAAGRPSRVKKPEQAKSHLWLSHLESCRCALSCLASPPGGLTGCFWNLTRPGSAGMGCPERRCALYTLEWGSFGVLTAKREHRPGFVLWRPPVLWWRFVNIEVVMRNSVFPFRLLSAVASAVALGAALVLGSPVLAKEGDAAPYQVGQWRLSDQQRLEAWIADVVEASAPRPEQPPLKPVIQELQALIESDPELYMQFTQMFEQIPDAPEFARDPTGAPQIRDYQQMLRVLDHILTRAPEFNQTGLVGFPINAILNWPMGTEAGSQAFLNPKLNLQLKKVLAEWARFLQSPDSAYVLDDDPERGWFGRDAMAAMPNFTEDFISDPAKPHYGFTSWDDFFTRQFRPGRRPVAAPGDLDVIANACESAPYRLVHDVKLRDRFWVKAQPYSLAHILDDETMARQFAGGTIYQAFLSALSYHRWHSPVSGTVVRTEVLDGSYYAAALSEGFDPASPNESQGYIPQVAARGIVYIQADNPAIGLMALVFVGMAEVSSNEITVYAGQHVEKGEQLGMFHFGGSTHLLVFRPGVELEFDLRGQTPGLHSENIPVRATLATVKSEPGS